MTEVAGGRASGAERLGLSEREREILALVGTGRTDKDIAKELFISVSTVRSHLDRIRDKTGCRRRPELTRLALELELELEQEGLPEPVPTTETPGRAPAPETVSPVPLPRTVELNAAVHLVQRDIELATLDEALHQVGEDKGRELVLISGEAGQGKSTLASTAARTAWEAGACVLFGHCEEDLAAPYQLFVEALGHYVRHADEQALARHAGPQAAELVRLVPELATRLPDPGASKASDAESERYMLFAAVVSFLHSLGKSQPIVLVLDDLQWADKGSLQLLRHVAVSEQAKRILIVGTYRDTELHGSGALVEMLGALRRLSVTPSRIDLSGLDEDGVVSLMEGFAGHALDPAALRLAGAVSRETDGNPFFVVEVLRHLAQSGMIYQETSGRWSARSGFDPSSLPDSVREVIRARLVRLGEEAERAVSLASVIGLDFELDLLSEATKTPEDALLDLLDTATAAALIREHPDPESQSRYCFTHPLVQHLVYEGLGPARQARFHRVVGEALEALYGDRPGHHSGALARHWVNATKVVDLVKAIDYSRQAAEVALSALAPDDALRYYAQALDLLERLDDADPLAELDLKIGLGTAQRQTGDARFRETLIGAAHMAEALGNTEHLVVAALANDRGSFSTVGQLDEEKVAILEHAIERTPARDRDRASLLALLCSELTIGSPLERRMELADEAISIAEQYEDAAVTVSVLNHVQIPLAVPPLLQSSLDRSARCLELAEGVGDPVLLRAAASARRYSAGCKGDVAEMDRCFEMSRPLVERLGQPFMVWVETLQRATRALIAGDADAAELLTNEAFQIGTEGGQPDAFIIFGAQTLMVSWWRGTIGDMVSLIEGAVADYPGLPFFAGVLALAHAEGDRPEQAREILSTFARDGFRLPMDVTWLTGMVAYAEAAAQARDASAAGPLLEQLRPFADQWHYSDIAAAGPVARIVGDLATVLGAYDEAEVCFADASASSEAAEAWYYVARTALSWATMLSQRGRPDDTARASTLLDRARTLAEQHGYANVARRAGRGSGLSQS